MNNTIPYMVPLTFISGGHLARRYITRGSDLYAGMLDLLNKRKYGVKTIRPGPRSPFSLDPTDLSIAVLIHTGVNRVNELIFSYDTGEIVSADYLWSNKKKKNAAFVCGKWVQTQVLTAGEKEYDRRWMFVDAQNIDGDDDTAPTGDHLANVLDEMTKKGEEALANQNDISLIKAEPPKVGIKSVYRVDFDLGDTITVRGNYHESQVMRITEYVEIEDENGEQGYPTLAID